jgi:hypothetical protein
VRCSGIESDSLLLVHFNDLLEGVVTTDRDFAQLFVVARLLPPSTAAEATTHAWIKKKMNNWVRKYRGAHLL